jgi:hypothetical protein
VHDVAEHPAVVAEERLVEHRSSVVVTCMASDLVKGEGFAVDASVMEANASRYHGKAPDEIVSAHPERQTRAVKEYLAADRRDAGEDRRIRERAGRRATSPRA